MIRNSVIRPFAFDKPRKGKFKLMFAKVKQQLNFGTEGLRTNQSGFIRLEQLESIKKATIRKLKLLKGRLWFRLFPNKHKTKKPAEVRMGKGKGKNDHWVIWFKKYCILLELETRRQQKNKIVLQKLQHKLSFTTKVMTNKLYQQC